MKESQYIPGFDWVRIFGSILVVAMHLRVFSLPMSVFPSAARLLTLLIPVFFIMSGFLCARGLSKERVLRQVLRYGSAYLAVQFILVVYIHATAARSGTFVPSQFGIDLLKCFVLRHQYAKQLWFIPALLYPMLLNAYLDSRKRRIVIAVTAVCLIQTEWAGADRFLPFFEALTASSPWLGRVFEAWELHHILTRSLLGLLFTTIGFDIDTWHVRPGYLLAAAIPLSAFELTVQYLGLASILLSIALFHLVKSLPGKALYPYHSEISIFAGTLYFLHFFGIILLQKYVTMNQAVCLVIIIAVHLLITLVACLYIRRGKRYAKRNLSYGL